MVLWRILCTVVNLNLLASSLRGDGNEFELDDESHPRMLVVCVDGNTLDSILFLHLNNLEIFSVELELHASDSLVKCGTNNIS
jgi:hypothetical protein